MLNVSLGMNLETVTTMVADDLDTATRAAMFARLAAL
jgi:hypothetical protein